MVRFTKISLFEETEKYFYANPKIMYDDSLVDRSAFIPTSEAIKSVEALSENDKKLYYDFVSGHDTGGSPPIGRRPGSDLAELSTAIREDQEKLQEASKKALDKKNRDKAYNESLIALSQPSSNSELPAVPVSDK